MDMGGKNSIGALEGQGKAERDCHRVTEVTERKDESEGRPTQSHRGKTAEFDYTAERRILPRSVHGEEECRKET